jgi:hypothetical protein
MLVQLLLVVISVASDESDGIFALLFTPPVFIAGGVGV